ncbi:hypothetical protein GCM10023178_08290 [Actinomadura luteofluorescens]
MAVTLKVHVGVKVKLRGSNGVQIGALARHAGVSPRALRYYEEKGLLVFTELNDVRSAPTGIISAGKAFAGR